MTEQNAQSSTPSPQIEKDIVVIMPFGSATIEKGNLAILTLMRIKYLIENRIEIYPRGSTDKVQIKYNVHPFRARSGAITYEAARSIADADVVVALITEINANVIYELAIRNLLKEEVVIILGGNIEKDNLPIYTKDFAYIDYHQSGEKDEISDKIKKFADQGDGIGLSWQKLDQSGIPNHLEKLISKEDSSFFHDLEDAMKNIESGRAKRPDFLQKLSKDLDPGEALSN